MYMLSRLNKIKYNPRATRFVFNKNKKLYNSKRRFTTGFLPPLFPNGSNNDKLFIIVLGSYLLFYSFTRRNK